jgi:hypothetical protein
MAAIAVHVIDQDVVTAGDRNAIILVENYAITYLRVVGSSQVKA